jgi:beta-aspartyl-peptidase (threonine type)
MNNNKTIAIAVHGGAGPMSDKIINNKIAYEEGLKKALEAGYGVLEKGGRATEAVEAAVRVLEDHPLFNAARGSALNSEGKVEMDAAIMDGSNKKAGAVSVVRNVRNPVSLAAHLMKNTSCVLVSGETGKVLAAQHGLPVEPDDYFITPYQFQAFVAEKEKNPNPLNSPMHGTVGAVALDAEGNVAAATSTGGIDYKMPGRVGDSCIIGAGCYADNATCAISCTGDGEHIIRNVVAHTVAMYMELKGCSLQEACDHVLHTRLKDTEADIGMVSVDRQGNFGITYNSDRMHHAWMSNHSKPEVRYR